MAGKRYTEEQSMAVLNEQRQVRRQGICAAGTA